MEKEKTDVTICLNSKVDGKQPSLEHRIYDSSGISTAITTGFLPSVTEPQVEQIGNIYPDTDNFKNRTSGRVYSADGLSPTLRTVTGGHNEPKIAEQQYRIRKFTPRECFRLMDVSESDIDKIQASGVSNSQQYKMAGNSIVVSCLYHLFRKMFIETENEQEQLTLFLVWTLYSMNQSKLIVGQTVNLQHEKWLMPTNKQRKINDYHSRWKNTSECTYLLSREIANLKENLTKLKN